MDYLINIANVFLLVSFSVKSVLLLRALNIVAGFFFITWALQLEPANWSMVAWNTLFGLINIRQIWLAILERRPPQLSEKEQLLQRTIFSELNPREFKQLLDLGQWEHGTPPLSLVLSGQTPERLWLVTEGTMEVSKEGTLLREIKAGHFVGEGSFLADGPMKADVNISSDACFLSWPRKDLLHFMETKPVTCALLQKIFSQCLVQKLESSQQKLLNRPS